MHLSFSPSPNTFSSVFFSSSTCLRRKMSSILCSQGVVLATAMAVSGILFLAFSRQKSFPSPQFSGNPNSQPPKQILRSCLSNDEKKRERKKKRVQFAENVKEPSGNGKEFRKEQRQRQRLSRVQGPCRNEIPEIQKMPENQVALYNGILRDRVHRMACSY